MPSLATVQRAATTSADALAPLFIERRKPAPLNNELRCMLSAFDALAHGMAVITQQAHMLYANRVARHTFTNLGWSQGSAEPGLLQPTEQPDWHAALRATCTRQTHHIVEIARPRGAMYAALTPLTLGEETCALVTLGRTVLGGTLELQMFASLHRLSHAESQILQHVCHGHRPSAIADLQGVAVSTVITHLSAIRTKTDCPSVHALLRKVASLPPIRPALLPC